MKSIAYNISLFFTCRRTNKVLFAMRQPVRVWCLEIQNHGHEQVYGWILLWLYKVVSISVYVDLLPTATATLNLVLVPVAGLLRYLGAAGRSAHDDAVDAEHGGRSLGRELDRPLLRSEGVQNLMLRRRQRSVLFRLGEVM